MNRAQNVLNEKLPEPIDQRYFHHIFASIGTVFFCIIAVMEYRAGILQMSQASLVSSLLVFCLVNIVFTLCFFFPVSERIKREYLVLFHMLWGQVSLITLAYFAPDLIGVAMMLSLATFVFVSFGMASLKLGVAVSLVAAGFVWVVSQSTVLHSDDERLITLLAYTVSSFFIAFINAYAGNLQMFLEKQNFLIKHRTEQLEKSQAALTESKEKAEQLSQSKTRFLAAASHDLRQPLHALELYVGALPAQDNIAARDRVLNQIERASSELSQLLNSLFDISRFDADVAKVDIKPVKISNIVEDLDFEFRDIAATEGRPLSIHSSEHWVLSDPILLHRIIRSLLSNALKHAKKGRVVVGFRSDGDHLRCEVWDSGVGVSAEDQSKIFEEFYQVGNTDRDRTKGLGLGLALVKRMCGALGHDLGMRSEHQKGSVFWFSMPKVSQEVSSQEAAKRGQASDRLRDVNLLCIDDEQSILIGMEDLFSQWGALALCADSYKQAKGLLKMSNSIPEVIICDYRLPGELNGIDVIGKIRQQFDEDIPAILITGDLDPSIDIQVGNHAIKVLKKPVSASHLYREICAALPSPVLN